MSLTNGDPFRLPRVLLIDDHVLMLDALAALLADEWNIVGKVSETDMVLHAVDTLEPDVVVLDISMPGRDGLELAREILQRLPCPKLVFVTMREDPHVAADAFRLGASAYVLKTSAGSELSAALRAVVDGKRYITLSITEAVLQSLVTPAGAPPPRLTDKQRDVLRLLAQGHTMKEIAGALDISTRTVAFHKYRAMEQLGIKSSAELIQYAVRQAIV